MDTLGFEPRAFRMRSDVIPLHHVPCCLAGKRKRRPRQKRASVLRLDDVVGAESGEIQRNNRKAAGSPFLMTRHSQVPVETKKNMTLQKKKSKKKKAAVLDDNQASGQLRLWRSIRPSFQIIIRIRARENDFTMMRNSSFSTQVA